MQKKLLCFVLSFIMITEIVVPVRATTISGVKNQQAMTQQNLNQVNQEIGDIESQRETVNTELEEMNDELVNILTSIEILEEEIALKQKEIDAAAVDLEEAMQKETLQYEAMKKRIKFMYEQGDYAYVHAILGAVSYSDMMNKADYVEELYNYDRKLLQEFVDNKDAIRDLKMTLQDEQAGMKTAEYELGKEQDSLELMITLKRRTVEDFDTQLEDARKKASAYKSQLQWQTEKIRELEEEERKRKEEEEKEKEALEGEDSDGDGTTSIDVNNPDAEDSSEDSSDDDFNAGAGSQIDYDSSLGQQICSYAGQFVGNPYVFGGTSLTDGADCSGFTQSVFAHFGISLPRDSYSQRSCGVGVPYEQAQPGDLICYAGHVAIYIGNGQIIHASTERTGITYGYATYRTILAVRRVI